jgi:molybdopterin/thiamine biosynthesis adenylyltransferase/molybdopterin synthase catalytic subunit
LSSFHQSQGDKMFEIQSTAFNRDEAISKVLNDKAGALVVFEGWVRDHNQGKKVSSLEYQVYRELASKEGRKILTEAKELFNIHDVYCIHREGHLKLGDIAVWIGAVASHRDDAFKATRYVIDEIKHRLPIWKKEHYVAEEPQWVFCRDHHHHVHFEEADYYAKQSKLIDQDLLKKKKVTVIGAGGLGCPVLQSLTMAGIGSITIVDDDKISLSNIHRQPLYSPNLVGEKKAIVAQKRMMDLNPFITIQAIDSHVDVSNVEGLFADQDLVIDCTDNMRTKFLLHDAAFKLSVPLVAASIHRYEGQVRTFVPSLKAGCLRCQISQTPEDSLLGNCNDFGVLGASVGLIAQVQAMEAITYLKTGTNKTSSSTFLFNTETLTQMSLKNLKLEDCPVCRGDVHYEQDLINVSLNQFSQSEYILVDMRDKEDAHLDQFKNSDKKVMVMCHRGVRSQKLVKEYRSQGCHHFHSVQGGACSH